MFLSCIESSIFRTTIQSTLKQCLCVSHAKRKFMSVRMIASDAKAGVTPSSQRESEPIAASNLLHHNTPKPTPLKIGAYDAKHDWSSTKNGCVFSIPKSAYEKLDTMGSITTQKKPFSFFDKPALLQRNITSTIVDILQRRTEFNSRDARYIIDGEPGSGRSVALIQAQLYAFQQPNILLLAVNNCDFWTNSTSAYEFEENSQQWIQPNLTASFLKPILEVNGNLLKKMALSNIPSDTPSALQNVSHLHDLLSIGVKNTTAAPAVLKLFFQQLQQLHLVDNAPVQILLTVDNLSIFTVPTRYKDPENKPIHPFNFQFINMIMEFLSGKRYFEHGTVLAATSSRPQVSTPSLNQALGKKAPNPYANLDDRVLQTLKEVNVLQSEPYSLEEARALMTYFVEANVCLESLDKHQQNYVLSGGNPRQFFHVCTSLT
ncbi:ribosomal protein subunit S23 [Schizosaccharomyces japonicus yFS275]|uniref:Small ribosomal subunit protein mS29 n=1 Tax=Schizosaccharomyces japonicus (strain yFS275 / FY16936) TaxID=402676 RepID=B6K0S9_SCHJY|nr:ribosomal protein subunit S23 [Schizosaccharomyces japonicus yFS275]EEB07550.1 ribosomal protein subunit S23 [Schizosaccharomyces japonicus yFS275]